MSRVLRERVERVALRSEPSRAKLNSNRRFGVAGREIKPVPIEQFSWSRQNT